MLPENAEAWRLWLHIATQWRVGINGAVGLDYPAVRREAWHLGIDMTHGMMRKIRAIERLVLEKCHDRCAGND